MSKIYIAVGDYPCYYIDTGGGYVSEGFLTKEEAIESIMAASKEMDLSELAVIEYDTSCKVPSQIVWERE